MICGGLQVDVNPCGEGLASVQRPCRLREGNLAVACLGSPMCLDDRAEPHSRT